MSYISPFRSFNVDATFAIQPRKQRLSRIGLISDLFGRLFDHHLLSFYGQNKASWRIIQIPDVQKPIYRLIVTYSY